MPCEQGWEGCGGCGRCLEDWRTRGGLVVHCEYSVASETSYHHVDLRGNVGSYCGVLVQIRGLGLKHQTQGLVAMEAVQSFSKGSHFTS
jgi:hypothetical protein